MRQQNSQGSRFGLSGVLEFLIFIVAIILLQIPMLYVIGSESYYTEDKHPLDSVFNQPQYSVVRQQLTDPKQQFVIVTSEEDSGVVNFMKCYASNLTKIKPVVIREYSNDQFQAIYAYFRFAKSLVEDKVDLEDDVPKLWILFLFSGDIPRSDIYWIQTQNPLNRIIIVTPIDSKLKGFKNIKFPTLQLQNLKKVLSDKMQMDEITASILIDHYETIPNIFENLNQNSFKLSQHLGDQYVSMITIDETDKLRLQNLCHKGQIHGNTDDLVKVGVILQNNRYYWKSANWRLNYAIQEKEICKRGIATQQILQYYDNIHDDHERKTQDIQSEDKEQQQKLQQPNKQKQDKKTNKRNKKNDNTNKTKEMKSKKINRKKKQKKDQSDEPESIKLSSTSNKNNKKEKIKQADHDKKDKKQKNVYVSENDKQHHNTKKGESKQLNKQQSHQQQTKKTGNKQNSKQNKKQNKKQSSKKQIKKQTNKQKKVSNKQQIKKSRQNQKIDKSDSINQEKLKKQKQQKKASPTEQKLKKQQKIKEKRSNRSIQKDVGSEKNQSSKGGKSKKDKKGQLKEENNFQTKSMRGKQKKEKQDLIKNNQSKQSSKKEKLSKEKQDLKKNNQSKQKNKKMEIKQKKKETKVNKIKQAQQNKKRQKKDQ